MPNPEYVVQSYAQMAVLVAEETVAYGQEVTPAAGDALKLRDAKIALIGNEISEDLVDPNWGNDLSHFVGKFVEITGTSFIAGSGAAGNLPGIATVMRCAGHAEDQQAADVTYTPVQDGIPSLTAYFQHGRDTWKIVGGRANVTIKPNKGGWFDLAVRIVGLFALPEDNAGVITTPAYVNWNPPQAVEYDTLTASLHGQAVIMHDFSFDCGNNIAPIDVSGQKEVRINNRLPTSQITIAAPNLTIKDFYQIAAARTLGPFTLQLGATAGDTVVFRMPACQIKLNSMESPDIEGDKGLTMALNPIVGAVEPDYDFVWS